MRRLIQISVDNPVLVNILMVSVILDGLVSFFDMPQELISEVKFNWVFIITPYPGASSEEVEQLITIPIEEEIQDVDDLEEILSNSDEGYSFIMVKFRTMSDDKFRARYLDMKAEIDKVQNLPENARRDMDIAEFSTTEMVPVITANLNGPLTDLQMRELAVDLRRAILQVKGVAKAELTGTNERQVWVELDPQKLEAHGLSPDMVSQALAQANRNVPAGKIRAGREEFLLRTIGRFQNAERIKGVIVRSMPGGDALKVEDLARVTDGFEEEITRSRLNGNKSVAINITKRNDASTIEIIKLIQDLVARYEKTLPEGVGITLTADSSVAIKEVMDVLRNNAVLGLILVVILLYLAIGARNALMVAVGIPVTFLTTFICMNWSGNSINGNSLFGLILVLGIVVDDAIIIVENCYRHYQMGKSIKDAAVDGAHEVSIPVLSATLTTVAAFLPLILMTGIMGRFLRIIPIVVCLVLAASMVEAFILLPSHFAEWTGRRHRIASTPPWLKKMQRRYVHLLTFFLRRRVWMLLLLVAALVGAGMLLLVTGAELSTAEEVNAVQIFVDTPTGTSLDVTDQIMLQVEKAALGLPEKEVESVQGLTGLKRTDEDWYFANNLGEVMIELAPKKTGRRSLDEIIGDLRGRLIHIPGIQKLEVRKPHGGPPTGKPVEVRVLGKDFTKLVDITEQLKSYLGSVKGVVDIQDSWKSTKRELRIEVDEAAAAYYGLDLTQIASFIRTVFEGQISTTYRDGNDYVEVLVRYPQEYEKDMEIIKRLKVPGLDARGRVVWLPFQTVASVRETDSFPKIDRLDQERYIAVTANIDQAYKDKLVEINQNLEKYWSENLALQFPGYRIKMGGQFKEFEEAFASLGRLFLLGVFLIYVILGGQFKSFIQPFIVLFAIPFSFIGAMFGLLVAGAPFSIVAMYGMVALAGVAVNDAIVMIDFINGARRRGADSWTSIVNAGRLRLRPIFLTTVTTIGGLLPTAVGLGGRSETWAPLANVIVFGILCSTLMTLFIVPCLYRIFVDDIPGWHRRRKEKRRARRAASLEKRLSV